MARQRTLFIVPALLRAGAETQIVQLVNGLSGEFFEKHLLSYLPQDDLLSSVDDSSVVYHRVRRQSKVDLAAARDIGKVIDEQQIDVVHCTLEHALLYGTLATAFATRKPIFICAIHSTAQTDFKHRLADAFLYRHLLKRCTQVWFMCQSQADLWIERMPFLAERSKVIYNGVKIDEFDPANFKNAGANFLAQLGIPAKSKITCSVAGLRAEKYHDVLIRAFARFLDDCEGDHYLLLAGSGEMETSLRQLAQQLELESRVIFVGELADVRPLLSAAHCKVLASAAETFSMAMLEAMAMQVPVVCTRVGGAGEAIHDRESGLLVTPGRVQELADCLSWLLADESRRRRIGRAGRKVVSENFSYGNMVRNSHDCLVEIA
ncbi:MAG: glycosyltransferase [Woeseiaceae bacterium]